MDDQAARDRIARVEALLDEVEALPDTRARETATEIVQALVELYGEGLARIMARADGVEGGLLEDELVAHLLLLHDLHPVAVEDRVRGALTEVRPYLESHGGDVELVAVEGDVVRLRLEGSCSGCPSSTMTLKLAIEDAIRRAAPEIETVEAEGAVPEAAPPLLQIQVAGGPARAQQAAAKGERWSAAGALGELSSGGATLKRVDGDDVLFLRLEESCYAYRPDCPGCHATIGPASLRGVNIVCQGCGLGFDAIRAGRCLDQPQLQLEPVPLLTDGAGQVRVALRAAVA